MFFVAVMGPGIDYIAQVAVYYWQIYAPAIAVFDVLISNTNSTINNFDAERIKGIVQVFQDSAIPIGYAIAAFGHSRLRYITHTI